MGSSAKKKREKKQDFQKTKLKVGKARPKNTNATDTSFAAKSIIFKQQNLSEIGRDAAALFNHNLSLLSSKSDTQRRDALTYLTSTAATATGALPQPTSVVLAKAQPLLLDGGSLVRQQLLKLLKVLPRGETGPLDQLLLYTRAGMTHLSTEIRLSALDALDWLIETYGEALWSTAGGWVKTLQAFQNLLSWHGVPANNPAATVEKWTRTKPATSLGSNKLVVHQLVTLARFLSAGLARARPDPQVTATRAATLYPLWHTDAHVVGKKSNPFGDLNLFGAPRNIESEIYDDVEERVNIFIELGLQKAFRTGVKEAKKEAGEIGRAAASVDKALGLVDIG